MVYTMLSHAILAFFCTTITHFQPLRAADTDMKSLREDWCDEIKIRSSKESVCVLYGLVGRSFLLNISNEQLTPIKNPAMELKQLFADNNIIITTTLIDRTPSLWNVSEWEQAFSNLKMRASESVEKKDPAFTIYRRKISYDTLKILLYDVKGILKSFLPNDGMLLVEDDYVIKPFTFNRLFTYAMLKQVIDEDGMSHVHLPRKMIIVKNVETREVLNNNEACKVLNNIINAYVSSESLVDISIGYYSKEYTLSIWAEEQARHNISFNAGASKELVQLTKKVPFDVGRTNIFSGEKGDAIIIDTENKDDDMRDSVSKLARYGVPKEYIESALTDM